MCWEATVNHRYQVRKALNYGCLSAVALTAIVLSARPAVAVPSLAAQTGQPCSACHIGGFGPQLTAFGREFKIGGYTQTGGDGLAAQIPLSAMILGSFNNIAQDVPHGSYQHYGTNNNVALDQISIFLAGNVGEHSGGFVQTTYANSDNSIHLDQLDIRPFTTAVDVHGNDLRLGTTLTNAPMVQDPFNSTFNWGFPYVVSTLAPTPAANPILVGGFAGNSIGLTGYAFYDHRIYLEAGGYQTMSPYLLARAGTSYGPGQTNGVAPYLRAAYVWDWDDSTAHVGTILLAAHAYPATGGRTVNAGMGSDSYTDIAFDAGYLFQGDGTHSFSVESIYVHEDQNLNATAAGTGYGSKYTLNKFNASASYWYKNTYGASFAWQKTWGGANQVLYASPTPVFGSANGKPNNNAFILEADWVPFGKEDSWLSPFANLKLGVQYTIYTQFNGASKNYDGNGRNAADNNTLYAFAWVAF
jgi:hypothetical protein